MIHNCQGKGRTCTMWEDTKTINKDCQECNGSGGRNVSEKTASSSQNLEPVRDGAEQSYERIEPIYYNESARKVTDA